jgi:hypothetical protein
MARPFECFTISFNFHIPDSNTGGKLYVIQNRCDLYYYRSNPETPFNTSSVNTSVDGSYYDPSKETVILLSGWLMNVDGEPWASVGPAILSNVSTLTAFRCLAKRIFLSGCHRISHFIYHL